MQATKLAARRVGRYQLLEKIPGGGMTEVYRARVAGASGPERPLVLKILPAGATGTDEAEARFVGEAKIALALTHGNIVATFEAGRDEDGQLFLVMEYVHGCSLRALLGRGASIPLEPALFIGRETARALRYTHTYQEPGGEPTPHAHLDVSPENVLLSHTGQVKLTDFGIARAVGAGRTSKVAYGKAAYVAPEILAGEEGGPPADLYALGCVLYELLTGAPPRRGPDLEATLALVREDHPIVPLSELGFDPEVDRVVMALLSADPRARGADAAAVEVALSSLLARRDHPYTEPELATLLRERSAIEPAGGSSTSARLAAQLAEAGTELGGHEGTAELLALGTVPLNPAPEAPSPPVTPREGSEAVEAGGEPSVGRRLTVASLAVAVIATLGLLFWARPGPFGSPEAGGEVKTDPGIGAGNPPPDPVTEGRVVPGTGTGLSSTAPDPAAATTDPPIRPSTGTSPEVRPGAGANPRPGARPGAGVPVTTGTPSSTGMGTGAGAKEPASTEAATDPVPPVTGVSLPPSRPTPEEMAHVQINAFPYAEIWTEDGKRLGDTPLRDLELPPGKQRLRLVNRELHLEQWVDLDLAPGEEKTVGIRLDR